MKNPRFAALLCVSLVALTAVVGFSGPTSLASTRGMSVVPDTTTAERAKIRGDSLLAVAKCWRFAKQPDVAVPTTACPDSVEAYSKMLPHAPIMHLTPSGEWQPVLQVGQTLQLKATLLRGYLFIWADGVDSKGWRPASDALPVAPPDALKRIL